VALGTVSRLRRVHFLLAVTCFGDLGHWSVFLLLGVSLHTRANGLLAASTARPVAVLRLSALRGGKQDSLHRFYISLGRLNSAVPSDRFLSDAD
jgi:hypothetical protein